MAFQQPKTNDLRKEQLDFLRILINMPEITQRERW
jgi:hypothetical protein